MIDDKLIEAIARTLAVVCEQDPDAESVFEGDPRGGAWKAYRAEAEAAARAATARIAELEAERDVLRGVLSLLISDVDMAAHDLNSGLLAEPLRIARAGLAATSGGK